MIASVQVARVLDRLAVSRGLPQAIGTDNGKEFCGKAMVAWVHERGMQLRLIQPGKPNQNAYIESLNGRLRDECLNEHLFPTLLHSRTEIETRVAGLQRGKTEEDPGCPDAGLLCSTDRGISRYDETWTLKRSATQGGGIPRRRVQRSG